MSEEYAGVETVPWSNGQPLPGSFEARMQDRRVQREQRTTELFTPPGFEDLFRVELQVVGFRRQSDIQLQHQRVAHEGMRALAIAAETLVAATVGFHLVREDGSTVDAGKASWLEMAQAYDPTLGTDTIERVAVIRLLEGSSALALYGQWNEWNLRGNQAVEKELAADFPET